MDEPETHEDVEIWEEVTDFPKYLISSHGRLRHIDRISVRKLNTNYSGFPVIALYGADNNTRYLRQVNRLVAEAFLPSPKYSDETAIWHIDGDLLNCRASNLRWATRPQVLEWNRMNRDRIPSYKTPQVYNRDLDIVYDNAFDCAINEGMLESRVIWLVEGNQDMFDADRKYSYVKGW